VALGLARFGYGLFVPAMSERLGWTLARAGGLTTANGLGYLVGAALTTAVAGRIGLAAAFRAGLVLTTGSLVGSALSGAYPMLVAVRAAGGFGGALVFISGAALAARLADATGSVSPVTVYFCGAGSGVALAGGGIPLLLNHHPQRWPLGWLALAAAAALATLGSWRAASAGDAPVGGRSASLRALWRLRRLAAGYVLFGAGYLAYLTFLSAHLAAHHAPVPLVCLTWVLIGLAATTAPALWGRPIASWGGTRALGTLLAGVALAAGLPLLGLAAPVVGCSALLFGSTFMMVPAAVTAFVAGDAAATKAVGRPDRDRAAGDPTGTLAALTVVFAAGQSAGPWVTGLLADHTGTGAVLATAAALCGAAAVLAAMQSTAARQRG
jgi:predicted MFS family arabinose efflux permease